MTIVLAADHGGFDLKEVIKEQLRKGGFGVKDVGCSSGVSVDYPDYAAMAVACIVSGECDRGILICGTGIGMSIAANRHPNIRAANCHDEYTTIMSREHNDANVLCLGARVIDRETALKLVFIWLDTDFAGGRHLRRVGKLAGSCDEVRSD